MLLLYLIIGINNQKKKGVFRVTNEQIWDVISEFKYVLGTKKFLDELLTSLPDEELEKALRLTDKYMRLGIIDKYEAYHGREGN